MNYTAYLTIQSKNTTLHSIPFTILHATLHTMCCVLYAIRLFDILYCLRNYIYISHPGLYFTILCYGILVPCLNVIRCPTMLYEIPIVCLAYVFIQYNIC